MLIGGAPLDEPLLLWWNFVERTHEDVVAARQRWLDGGFDPVPDTEGAIPPPPLAQ